MEIYVSRGAARRFLLEALHLHAPIVGPRNLLPQIKHLEAVQIDPVARVGRNQDLVLMARYPFYLPGYLNEALAERQVFEYRANEACILPMEDYPLLEGTRQRLRARLDPELEQLRPIAEMVLTRLREEGTLSARSFETSDKVKGYWDTSMASTKTTSHVLSLLLDTGRIMVVDRVGTMRKFDLAERVVPRELWARAHAWDVDTADQALFDKYLRAYKLVRGGHERLGWGAHKMAWRRLQLFHRIDQGIVTTVHIDGVQNLYYVLTSDVARLQYWHESRTWPKNRIRFLPPLDNLVWDRERLLDLFNFYYRWEVYVPPEKRHFGVYAMPILAGDQIIGRIDPEVRRRDRRLLIHNLAWEPSFGRSTQFNEVFERALRNWAGRLGVEVGDWRVRG